MPTKILVTTQTSTSKVKVGPRQGLLEGNYGVFPLPHYNNFSHFSVVNTTLGRIPYRPTKFKNKSSVYGTLLAEFTSTI